MKSAMGVVGVVIALLLAMPGMGDASREDTGIAPIPGGEMGSGDTQSPVLDGSALTEYETIFFPGNAAGVETGSSGLSSTVRMGGYYRVWPHEGIANHAYIDCPLPSFEKRTGGVQPHVRYLGLQYKTPGLDPVEIKNIEVWNGKDLIKTKYYSPPLSSNGWTIQIIDLGAWYPINHGLTLGVYAQNSDSTFDRPIDIGGYGARFQW